MLLKVLLSILLITVVKGGEHCDHLGTLLYQDVGCTPIIPEDQSCPTHYQCGNFGKSEDGCFFQGESIPIGRKVNDSLIYGSCQISCHCSPRSSESAKFECAILDCPEWLNGPPRPGCYGTYELGKCCSSGLKCTPFEDEDFRCEYDGEKHRLGDKFYPKNTCLNCVCQKGFNGTLEEPFCRRSVCAEEIRYSDKLHKNCAPVYFGGETLCCPDSWTCASDNDEIKSVSTRQSPNSEANCKWGEKTLKLGEGLEREVEHWDKKKNVTCECVLPPFLTCKEKK